MQSGLWPLYTSNSNIYLNFSLNPNSFVTYIIPMYLYYPQYASWFQTCTCRGLCIQSSQAQAYVFTAKPESHWSTHHKAFVILVTALIFLKTKQTSAQERRPSCIHLNLHLHHHQGVFEDNTPHTSTSEWFARKLTTWIIRTSVGRSTSSYVCTFVRGSNVLQASGVANSMRKLIV